MEIAFPEAYARILEATGCDGQADLAQELGIPQALISDSRRRGEIRPEILLALLEQFAFARTGYALAKASDTLTRWLSCKKSTGT